MVCEFVNRTPLEGPRLGGEADNNRAGTYQVEKSEVIDVTMNSLIKSHFVAKNIIAHNLAIFSQFRGVNLPIIHKRGNKT